MLAVTTIYFGENWGVPALHGPDVRAMATPAGVACWYCEDIIEPGDQGYIDLLAGFPAGSGIFGLGFEIRAIHKECRLVSVSGNLACLQGRCDGSSGICHEVRKEEGRTVREDAIEAWAWVQERGLRPLGGGHMVQKGRP
jgi:hypothetical protein